MNILIQKKRIHFFLNTLMKFCPADTLKIGVDKKHHGCTGWYDLSPASGGQQERQSLYEVQLYENSRDFVLFGAVCCFLVTVHVLSELPLLLKMQITKRLLKR